MLPTITIRHVRFVFANEISNVPGSSQATASQAHPNCTSPQMFFFFHRQRQVPHFIYSVVKFRWRSHLRELNLM